MKLSIVELATIKDGGGATDALHHAVETARYADALGFHRIWFAEHHMAPSQASHHPELLIAAAAALTKGIRLGSGAVLLNHYSPFKVAEAFKVPTAEECRPMRRATVPPHPPRTEDRTDGAARGGLR